MAEDDSWSIRPEPALSWLVGRQRHAWRPPTDAFETDAAYIVVVEVAGVRGSDFAVTFEHQVLWVRGTRPDPGGTKAYHQMEIAYGDFETGVQIHAPVDETAIEAAYSDGFLKVTLPKALPRRIPIEPAS
jgi:HSP20 family molecular chaperone IbpA